MSSSYTATKNWPRSTFKYIILASVLGFNLSRLIRKWVLPHGPPVDVPMNERPIHSSIDFDNDSLRLKREYIRVYYCCSPPSILVFLSLTGIILYL